MTTAAPAAGAARRFVGQARMSARGNACRRRRPSVGTARSYRLRAVTVPPRRPPAAQAQLAHVLTSPAPPNALRTVMIHRQADARFAAGERHVPIHRNAHHVCLVPATRGARSPGGGRRDADDGRHAMWVPVYPSQGAGAERRARRQRYGSAPVTSPGDADSRHR
ncbi:hypothetical protein ACPA9J_27135 [Pseudomonas aeruginosa]